MTMTPRPGGPEYVNEVAATISPFDEKFLFDQSFEPGGGIPLRATGGAGVTPTATIVTAAGETFRRAACRLRNAAASTTANADFVARLDVNPAVANRWRMLCRFMMPDTVNYSDVRIGTQLLNRLDGYSVDYKLRLYSNYAGSPALQVLTTAGAWANVPEYTHAAHGSPDYLWNSLGIDFNTQTHKIERITLGEFEVTESIPDPYVISTSYVNKTNWFWTVQVNTDSGHTPADVHLDRFALRALGD